MSWDLRELIFNCFFPLLRTTDYLIVLPNVSINFGKEIGIGIKNKLACLRVLFLKWFFYMRFFLQLILLFNLLLLILHLWLLHHILPLWLTSSVLDIWLLYFLLNNLF